jgi:hypothetical protein
MTFGNTRSLFCAGMMLAACIASGSDAFAGNYYRSNCTELRYEPGSISCGANASDSADFVSSCSAQPARFLEVKVACPFVEDSSGSGDYYSGADSHAGQ